MHGRRSAAALASLAILLAGACGASSPSVVPTGVGGSAAAPTAAAVPASPDDPNAASVPPELLGALETTSLEAVSAAELTSRDEVDARSGLTALIGNELQSWLQERRSEAVKAALDNNGIDTAALGPSVISREPMAALDQGLTAAGLAWFGSGMAAAGLVTGGLGHVGGDAYSDSGTVTRDYETTRGDQHVATSITTQLQLSVNSSLIVADADVTEIDTVSSVSSGAALGSATTRSRVHVEAEMCPDASGGVAITVTNDQSGTGTPSGTSFSVSTTGTRQVTVGDDANVASDSQTLDSSFEDTAADGTHRSSSATLTTGTGSAPTFTSGGDYTPAEAAAAQGITSSVLAGISNIVLDKAIAAWQGGTCVEITATEGTRTVRPREIVTLTAQPRQRIEGVDLDKPVVATFRGEQSVAPVSTPVDAPADFTFTAAAIDDRSGTVTLTSTSNRGIGTLDVTFTVDITGWFIDQPFTNAVGATGKLTGKKCGSAVGGAWKVVGRYEFMGFEGRQVWKMDLNQLASLTEEDGEAVHNGTYTYVDTSTGLEGVTQRTDVTGTIEARLDEDGNVTMKLTETTRVQRARAPGGGWGFGPDVPLRTARDIVWTGNAPGC